MTSEELKNLKTRLWQTADQLRAGSGLKSSQYLLMFYAVILSPKIDSLSLDQTDYLKIS